MKTCKLQHLVFKKLDLELMGKKKTHFLALVVPISITGQTSCFKDFDHDPVMWVLTLQVKVVQMSWVLCPRVINVHEIKI